ININNHYPFLITILNDDYLINGSSSTQQIVSVAIKSFSYSVITAGIGVAIRVSFVPCFTVITFTTLCSSILLGGIQYTRQGICGRLIGFGLYFGFFNGFGFGGFCDLFWFFFFLNNR